MNQQLKREFALTPVTWSLILINVAIFGLEALAGGLINPSAAFIYQFGGVYPAAIVQFGEWWRLGSAMFVHIGVMHLVMNMLTLYYVGRHAEVLLGKWRYLMIYLLAGIFGNLACVVFAAPYTVSAGASGAIFGVFGIFVMLWLEFPQNYHIRPLVADFVMWAAVNVVFTFAFSQDVSLQAHLGGLFAGFLLAEACGAKLVGSISLAKRITAAVVLIGLFGGLLVTCFANGY